MSHGGAQWALWAIAAVSLLGNFYTLATERERRLNEAPSLAWMFWLSAIVLSASIGASIAILQNAGAGAASAAMVLIAALVVSIRSTQFFRMFGRVITMVDK